MPYKATRLSDEPVAGEPGARGVASRKREHDEGSEACAVTRPRGADLVRDGDRLGGTFGILIPIVLATFGGEVDTLCLISISAALSGAVTGDHCSPISETAVMPSTAAQVDFMQHVMAQLPYAGFVAVLSSGGSLLAGFV